jgi:hypothetical protein
MLPPFGIDRKKLNGEELRNALAMILIWAGNNFSILVLATQF